MSSSSRKRRRYVRDPQDYRLTVRLRVQQGTTLERRAHERDQTVSEAVRGALGKAGLI